MRLTASLCILVAAGQTWPARADNLTTQAIPISRPVPDVSRIVTPGSVTIRFDINSNGAVARATVVDSTPASVYRDEALAAVRSWRYEPRRTGGHAVGQPGNLVTIKLEPPEDGKVEPLTSLFVWRPDYPRAAFERGVEGWVTVEFSVNELGLVDAARVVAASPKDVFEKAALNSVRSRHYVPPMVNDQPARVAKVVETIPFNLKNAELSPTRIGRVQASYPESALNLGVEGSCAIGMTIAEDGNVANVDIIASAPTNIFDATCRDVGYRSRFRPPSAEQDAHVRRTQVLNINFKISGVSSPHGPLLGPGQWVRVGFDLTRDGSVVHARVLSQNCGDQSAKRLLDVFETQRFDNARSGDDPAKRKNLVRTYMEPSRPPTF